MTRLSHLDRQPPIDLHRGFVQAARSVSLLALLILMPCARGAENPIKAQFENAVQPILIDYLYRRHGQGMKKGWILLEEFPSDEAMLHNRDLWWAVLKNVRAGIMPPAGKPRPGRDELHALEDWVKRGVFGSDSQDPD